MRKPNFFLVGAPRCGTTSLYTLLKQHPQIHLSPSKEPHFFGSDLTPMPGSIREEPLYLSLFAAAADRPCAGEGSVWYLSSTRAAAEIRAFSPQAKILILLRDPLHLAASLYGLYRRTGNEDLPTFEAALAAEPARRAGRRLPPAAYFPEGLLYTDAAQNAAKVARYFDVFGRDRVLCVLFDDFVRDTAAVYRRVLEFLAVDPAFQPELDPARARQKIRMQAIRQLRQLPPAVRGRLQLAAMRQHEGATRAVVPPAVEARLRSLFAPDVARLAALLGRDLSAWEPAARARRSGTPPPAAGSAGLGEVLASVRVLRQIPREIRARHEAVETLEGKLARWQRLHVPAVPLSQLPYDDAWPVWFAAERRAIAAALAEAAPPPAARQPLVEHFGSTAVPGLSSKNIVDIAVALDGGGAPPAGIASPAPPALPAGIAGEPSLRGARRRLAAVGYADYGNSPIDPQTQWLWKIEDRRAFVVHLCDRRQPWLDEQLALRDYLRAHAAERERYAQLKRRLAADGEGSFLRYTAGKISLSLEMIERAREWRSGLAGA